GHPGAHRRGRRGGGQDSGARRRDVLTRGAAPATRRRSPHRRGFPRPTGQRVRRDHRRVRDEIRQGDRVRALPPELHVRGSRGDRAGPGQDSALVRPCPRARLVRGGPACRSRDLVDALSDLAVRLRGRGIPSTERRRGSRGHAGRRAGRAVDRAAADHAAAACSPTQPTATRQRQLAASTRRPTGSLNVTISKQRAAARAAEFDPAWLAEHLERERREASVLSEIREAVFGAQDGLTSVLAVVSTVGGATGDSFSVLIAGFAATLAGVFSMAAGEYMSSKSQREIFEAQIATEAKEVEERPGEAEAEVAFMLEQEGLQPDAAQRVARGLASSKRGLLKRMVEKELGLTVEDDANALRGAAVMGGSFGLAALVPILPYLFPPVHVALYLSVGLAAVVLFGMGALKS